MDLSGLTDGMIVKNYKEMCKLLKEEIKTGKSKQLQMKNWKRYFNYDKYGQKYIIYEIYDEPIENNKNIYIQHIEYLLLNFLMQQKGYKVQLTLKKLFYEFNFVSDKYFKIEDKELKNRLNCDNANWYINHYKYRTDKKMKDTLESALKSLQNRRLIEYSKIHMIKIIQKIDDYELIDIREANEIEINYIKDIERIVLEQMEYPNINTVYLNNRQYEYYAKVNGLLKTEYDIDQTWQEISILFTKEYIENGLKETDKQIEKLKTKELRNKDKFNHKKVLNDKFTSAIDKQAEYYYNKNKIDYFGELNKDDKRYYYNSDNYLYSQKKLNEWIGKMESIDIVK